MRLSEMTPISTREFGSGNQAVVVMSGTGMPTEHVEALARELATADGGRRVIVPFFHGYGDTPRASEPYTLEHQQSALEDALSTLGLSEAAVVGLSLGS